ncbi:MAG: hypothetical protein JXQ29_10210, partial [Planctomycetes bacterium]|nr:hypothetical protein [Planctomycetota bacterium]
MKALGALVGPTILVLAAIAATALPGAGQLQPDGLSGPPPAPLLRASLAQIPLHIIENRGVHPEPVRFYVQGKDRSIFFAPDGITFVLQGKGQGWAVKLEFAGANPHVRLRGHEQRRAVFSYFRGPRENWKTGLKSFDRVVYKNLWPGIDLVYRAEMGALKYEFCVRPGADPRRIRLQYSGATSVTTTESGALRVETPVAVFEDAPPVAWVDAANGTRTPVEVRYAVAHGTAAAPTVGFEVGAYRSDRELVIDPAVFVYCGYIGGSGLDGAPGVAVDAQGCAYVGGGTQPSPTFPVKVGPITT